jgi:hypothetical protein
MTNHSSHNHPATPAARAACRKAMTGNVPNSPIIRTPAGKIRAGSVILAEVRGGRPTQYTVVVVEDDIKNGYAGWEADDRWGYADQVLRVIKF